MSQNENKLSYADVTKKNLANQTINSKEELPSDFSGFVTKVDKKVWDGRIDAHYLSNNAVDAMIAQTEGNSTHLYLTGISNTFMQCSFDKKHQFPYNRTSYARDYYRKIHNQIRGEGRSSFVEFYDEENVVKYSYNTIGITGIGIQPHTGYFAMTFNRRTPNSIVRFTKKSQSKNVGIFSDVSSPILVDLHVHCLSFHSDGSFILGTNTRYTTNPVFSNYQVKLYEAGQRFVREINVQGMVVQAVSLYGVFYGIWSNAYDTGIFRYDPRDKSIMDVNRIYDSFSPYCSSLIILPNRDLLISSNNKLMIYEPRTEILRRVESYKSVHKLKTITSDNFGNLYSLVNIGEYYSSDYKNQLIKNPKELQHVL